MRRRQPSIRLATCLKAAPPCRSDACQHTVVGGDGLAVHDDHADETAKVHMHEMEAAHEVWPCACVVPYDGGSERRERLHWRDLRDLCD